MVVAVLDRHSVAFLVAARRLGVSYETTLQIGRQTLPRWVALGGAFRDAGCRLRSDQAKALTLSAGGYSDALLRHLGGETVESIDASDWEQATFVHDLSSGIPDALRQRYSVVLEGGTLEHVFDFPTALRGVLDAVKVGGHFVAVTPTNGWCGHGFYQLSPELFYAALGPESGYKVRCALIRSQQFRGRFRHVPDPTDVRRRVPLRGLWPCLLYLVAERVEEQDLSSLSPRQSDYRTAWSDGGILGGSHRRRLKQFAPRMLQEPIGELYSMSWSLRRLAAFAGDFRRVRLSDLGSDRPHT